MTIKPMKNSNPKLNTKYINVAKTASKNNLEIAILDAKRNALEAEKDHTNLIESVSLNDREEIYFEKLTLKIAKQQHQNYSKKLEHLKKKK